MRKIKDRFLLGIISGLGGNLVKIAVERAAVYLFDYSDTGAKKAAGIFLKKKDADTLPGRILGNVADNLIASFLGITCIYWLTLMGKDYYLLKGAVLGAAEWTTLYGVTSKLGATHIYPSSPKNSLISFISHLAFGAAKIAIAVHLGDQRLFKPRHFSLSSEARSEAPAQAGPRAVPRAAGEQQASKNRPATSAPFYSRP
ncbi:MAG TPA: hypothetical protein PKO38_01830 [Bacillota bacterium]|nr:hypothetical protein [Bacillota bacterium]HPZ64094.1 hypothetical protein [Bacillota bacterium]HQD06101.1 hypothetical protein [Bacillota bacterium]